MKTLLIFVILIVPMCNTKSYACGEVELEPVIEVEMSSSMMSSL